MPSQRDLEAHHDSPKTGSNPSLASNSPSYYNAATYLSSGDQLYGNGNGDDKSLRRWIPMRAFDSFRRDPDRHIVDSVSDNHDEDSVDSVFDPYKAASGTANTRLARKLKGRHLQMIAIGGSIGEL